MTENEAINKLKQHFEYLKHAWKPHPDYETMDAIGYAISTLETIKKHDSDCSGDISHCKECDNYVLDYRDIQEQPTFFDMKAKTIDNFVNPFEVKAGGNS